MISYMKTHRFLLRLPEVLHQRALKKAASSDKSLNQFIEDAVTGAVSRAEPISLGAFGPLVRLHSLFLLLDQVVVRWPPLCGSA